jgi:glycosyltransferase involved in cell wall biosynthesis
MAFNESILMQFMIDHYRSRFPNCKFIVYDNESTDNTVDIILNNKCQVQQYSSNKQIDDFKLREHKNNCWKGADTDWVLVCDVDELLDITEKDLIDEISKGTTLIKSEAYTMVNMEDNYNISNIKYGLRDSNYDKMFLFNKKYIKEINYECGAHKCYPIGQIKYSDTQYKMYHHRFIHPDLCVARYKLTADRLSEANKRAGMGSYYFNSESGIRQEFQNRRNIAIKVI